MPPLPPCQVCQLSSLRELLLPGNQLRALPPLARLSRLTELDLSSNHLDEIPIEIAELGSLTILDLSHNRIAALPAWPVLPALLTLHLSHNALAALPTDLPTALPTDLSADLPTDPPTDLPTDLPTALATSLAASLPHLAEISLDHNQLLEIPISLLALEHRRGGNQRDGRLRLEVNPLPASVLLYQARMRSGVYLSVEFCIAPRPTASLKGDAARYLAAFVAVRQECIAVLGRAVAVLPNPGALETCISPLELLEPRPGLRTEHYPRLGSCEVVARSQLGGFCCLHSKVCYLVITPRWLLLPRSLKVSDPPHYFLPTTHYALRTTKVASRRFPEPCTVLASLLRHLGVPVPDRPEGYSLEHARHAHAELLAAAAEGSPHHLLAALEQVRHIVLQPLVTRTPPPVSIEQALHLVLDPPHYASPPHPYRAGTAPGAHGRRRRQHSPHGSVRGRA